jgi:hypothetical protein
LLLTHDADGFPLKRTPIEKLDSYLLGRFDEVEGSKALDWLMQDEADQLAAKAPPKAYETKEVILGYDETGAAIRGIESVPWSEPSFIGGVYQAVVRASKRTVRDVVATPKQMVGGVRDAGQSMLDLIEWVGDELPGALASLGLPTDPEETVRLRAERNMPMLPEVSDADGTLSSVARNVTQFGRW